MIRPAKASDASQIAGMRSRGLHCAIAGISLPSPASIALHEKLGYKHIGQFREAGWQAGACLSAVTAVAYVLQISLAYSQSRRSPAPG